MHDYTHDARLYEMDKALKDGQFPVRWSKDLGWGYGMPLFNFYAPLPYYFSEIFHLLGFSFLNSIKICFGATFLLAFLGMFLLANKFWGKYGAVLSAFAFVYSPYRAVDFYARGALGELFAISLIPLAIWSVFELIEQQAYKKVAFASLIMACLFLSHTVLTLMVIPLIFVVGVFYIFLNQKRLKSSLFFLFSFLLAIGLSSFFLIPAFLEKQFTRVYDLTQGYSNYSHHFLYWRQFLSGPWGYGGSVDSIPDGMSFHLGKAHLLLAVLTIVLSLGWLMFKKKITKKNLIIFFFSFGTIFLAFLSTYHAKFIWDVIPLMAYIQFPWRLNSIIIVFISLLAGGGCYYIVKILNSKTTIAFCLMSIILLLIINTHYFKPEKYINPENLYYTDEYLIKKNISGVIPDYLPVWVKTFPQDIIDKDFQIIDGDVKIDIIESKTQSLILKSTGDNGAIVQINRFYFPGWVAFIDKKKIDINYEDNGIMKIGLPAGDHITTIQFQPTMTRLISDSISLISLIIAIGAIIINKKHQ